MSRNDQDTSECPHVWMPWEYQSHVVSLDGKGGRDSGSVFARDCIRCPTIQKDKFPVGIDPNLDDDFG